jgi:hypothetical protein
MLPWWWRLMRSSGLSVRTSNSAADAEAGRALTVPELNDQVGGVSVFTGQGMAILGTSM